jgi:hypothetical protein
LLGLSLLGYQLALQITWVLLVTINLLGSAGSRQPTGGVGEITFLGKF